MVVAPTSIDAAVVAPSAVSPASLGMPYVPTGSTRRLLGAFYTPRSAADYMAAWALRHDGDTMLEPSFGDGIFLRAIAQVGEDNGLSDLHVYGVEIDARARQAALSHGLIESEHSPCRDFLGVEPFPVTAVIGNPPYVRLRHVDIDQRRRALTAAEHVLGAPLDPAGSLWMPFVLHSTRFLQPGGRMAFVLPYDFTYVRYARPLWQALRRRFGSLTVIRAHERLFPDLLQDVVILLADGFGESTDTVRFRAFDRLTALFEDRPHVDIDLGVDEIMSGERPFIEALLERELRQLLRGHLKAHTVPARELVTFSIGYVAGDKTFFHPDPAAIEHFGIPERSLRCAVTSARSIRGAGLRTSDLSESQMTRLFLPDPSRLSEGERRYIAVGEESGVSRRYKCRIRDPWFVVPGVRVPDVVVSVFSERPTLLVNDADCVASNSLLCGYARTGSGEDIAARWYTSLTLLHCEIEVHALGGGVMVMVPNEAGSVRLPNQADIRQDHLADVDRSLRLGRSDDAYRAGDRGVLMDQLGLGPRDVDLIREGIDVLTHWRTSARSSR